MCKLKDLLDPSDTGVGVSRLAPESFLSLMYNKHGDCGWDNILFTTSC